MTKGSGLSINPGEKDQFRQNKILQQIIEGRSNAVGSFTLATSATSTSVTAVTCGPQSVVVIVPTTANAATALTGTWISAVAAGTFTVRHSSTTNTDLSYDYIAVG